MKAFLYQPPEENAATDEFDEDEEGTGSIDSAYSQASGPAVEEDALFPDSTDIDAPPPTTSPVQNGQPNKRPGFPPLQRVRCNLTALSQQYNVCIRRIAPSRDGANGPHSFTLLHTPTRYMCTSRTRPPRYSPTPR